VPTCVPTTCAALSATCGSPSNGCGGTLSCGTCSSGSTCGTTYTCQAAPPTGSITIAFAGDVTDDSGQFQKTANQIAAHSPSVQYVLQAGDIARFSGADKGQTTSLLSFFATYYDKSNYGNFHKLYHKILPVPGNHEYRKDGTLAAGSQKIGQGYFDYFTQNPNPPVDAAYTAPERRFDEIKALPGYNRCYGQNGTLCSAADVVGKGWYSFDTSNGWHIVALNLGNVDGSDSLSGNLTSTNLTEQMDWLEADLSDPSNSTKPTIAFFHEDAINQKGTCAISQRSNAVATTWAKLVAHKVDLALVAHQHFYQRWVKLDAGSTYAPSSTGVREILDGAGGAAIGSQSDPVCTTSPSSRIDVRPADLQADGLGAKAQLGGDAAVGALYVTLNSDKTYSWQYVLNSTGNPVFDSGSDVSNK